MGGWSQLTLVTDADLGAVEPQAIATEDPPPWGARTWPAQRARAKTELKIWIEAAYPDVVGAADRILDRHRPSYVFRVTGGATTDITSQAVDDTPDDVDLAGMFATPGTDRLYVAAPYQFEGLHALLTGTRNAAASVLSAFYSGSAGWTSLAATDGTASGGATLAQSGRITWTVPSAWQPIRLHGTADEYFWAELRVSATLTAGTSLSQLLPIRAPDALKAVANYLALSFILQGLERGAAAPEEWQTKANHYYDRATKLFDQLKAGGGIPLDRNRDQSVSQRELEDYQPIRLRRA